VKPFMTIAMGSALIVLLMGCSRVPAPIPEPGDYRVRQADAGSAEDTATCRFCADPSIVRICEVHTGVPTTLHWHLGDDNVPVVNMFVVDEQGVEQAFAQQGAEGALQTGPWLRPGITFRLRDDRDGKQLAELVIDGVECIR
jgi:hypothetical protein